MMPKFGETPWGRLDEIVELLKTNNAAQARQQDQLLAFLKEITASGGKTIPLPKGSTVGTPSDLAKVLSDAGIPLTQALDMGTASGGSPTFLKDNSKQWGTNIWPGSLLTMSIGGQAYFSLITSNTNNQITIPSLPGGVQVTMGTPYIINTGPLQLLLDVPLSTRASQVTAAAILTKLDVALSTRGSEITLAGVLAKLDVALSTRASQVTAASILGQLDLTSSMLAHYIRWGIPREPDWVYGTLKTAPGALATLVDWTVAPLMTGRLFGFHLSAGEANEFSINAGATEKFRYHLGAAGPIDIVLAKPLIDSIPAGTVISIKNINAAGAGVTYWSNLFRDEAI